LIFKIVFVVCTIPLVTFLVLLSLVVSPSGRIGYWWIRNWNLMVLNFMGVRYRILGEIPETEAGMVVVANHQSNLDSLLVHGVIPLQMKFVAKKQLFRIPIFGWALWGCRHVSVKRDRSKRDLDSVAKIKSWLGRGFNIFMFPEGTRSRTGELARFKSGAFRVARSSGATILPVAIVGTNKILPPDASVPEDLKHNEVIIEYLPPVDTTQYEPSQIGELRNKVQQMIREKLESYANG
jgi:1-acyl-sn-glycerol-3-phosphate acyltransferase